MKGDREGFNDLGEEETYLSFYKRHTSLKSYNNHENAYSYLNEYCQRECIEVENFGNEEAEGYCNYLIEEGCGPKPSDLSQESAEGYAECLSRLFSWVVENTAYLDWEPFDHAVEVVDFEYDDRETKKREVPLNDLRQHICNIGPYLTLTYVMLMLKTGLRPGEATDLNLRDIHLDHPVSELMPSPRKEIAAYPDSLYVDSSKENSKDKSFREVPIDSELKSVLSQLIKMSPETNRDRQPLFVDLHSHNGKYSRLGKVRLWEFFVEWSKQEDLWIKESHPLNVTPHWCRHWFTTVLRANVNDDDVLVGRTKDYLEGLRGDSGDGVIDTYSHEWNSLRDEDQPSWREIYENAMPSLLTEPEGTDVSREDPWKARRAALPDKLL